MTRKLGRGSSVRASSLPDVIRPYREVLALPGAAAFSAAGFLARMPMSMISIGVVLLVQSRHGSYGLAGAVTATAGLSAALASPRVARLIDRYGQSRVLRPAVLISSLGLLGLVAAVLLGAPIWTFFLAAAVTGGAALPHGSLVRARWSALLGGGSRLNTAYSLESVLDEIVFIVGPLAVTVLATRATPSAGLIAATALTLIGSFALAGQRTTEPVPTGAGQEQAATVLRVPGLVVIFATFLAVGGIFGSAEVTVIAFAGEHGSRADAGLVLAAFALGSMLAGLGYGAVQWRSRLQYRFLAAVALLAAGTVPMALAGSVPVLTAVMFLAGFAISPMVVAGYALVGVLAPTGRLTEALAWTTTGINIGYAGLVAVSGIAIDAYGASRAFLVTVACGVVSVGIALTGRRWLGADSSSRAPGRSVSAA